MADRLSRPIFTGVLAAASVACLVSAVSLSPTARLIPLMVLFPTCILLFLQLYSDCRTLPDKPDPDRRHGVAVTAGLWVLAAPLLIMLAGFTPGTVIFVAAYTALYARENWITVLLVSAATWLGLNALGELIPALVAPGGVIWG